MIKTFHRLSRGLSSLALTSLLAVVVYSGEPGTPAPTWPYRGKLQPLDELREVPVETWQRRAISCSGSRGGQSPKDGRLPSDVQVLEDLRRLLATRHPAPGASR